MLPDQDLGAAELRQLAEAVAPWVERNAKRIECTDDAVMRLPEVGEVLAGC